jgi:aldose 1-epimerase
MIVVSRWAAAAAMIFAAHTVVAADAKRVSFGTLANGTHIESVELTNGAGVSVRLISLGAAVQSLVIPDRNGKAGDIVLGYSTPQEYLDRPGYFGATVGRYANRIAKGKFTLDGHTYTLATNDHGINHLHGGNRGFDKVVWKIDSVKSGPSATVVLSYVSPDGEEGYPGTLRVTATYSLSDRNELRVEYQATTDKPTIVNISNHSYFNLSSESAGESVMGELLQINASRYTPVDATLIPTGELRSVAGTPFDFRKPAAIGLRIRDGRDQQIVYGRGYDHNFVLDGRAGELHEAVRVEDPKSGRVMDILTTAPGVQFYSGNFLDASIAGKSGVVYRQGDALALEPQLFPDSPNHPGFPSARLAPGSTYRNTIVYRFSTSKAEPSH